MSFFFCEIWQYLAGALAGWLLLGWQAHRFKYAENTVQIIGNKDDKQNNLASYSESSKAEVIEKIVEKWVDVDNPKLLERIKTLENENTQMTELTNKVAQLEIDNSKIPDLQNKIKAFATTEPKIIEKEIEKTVDNPRHIKKINLLETELKKLKQRSAIDFSSANTAGFSLKEDGDFTVIDGINPKISTLLHAGGIHSFKELSGSNPTHIQKILDAADSSMLNPGTWPDQAYLAANNRWLALKTVQDLLDGGIYPDSSQDSNDDKE